MTTNFEDEPDFEGAPDGELIRLFIDVKQQKALDVLSGRYQEELYGLIEKAIGDPTRAKDLSQELWERVREDLPNFKDSNKFGHYLNTITKNLIEEYIEGAPDGELIRLFIDVKQQKALDVLLGRYHKKLYGRITKAIGDPIDAQDLSQELWIRVIKYLPKYKDSNKFGHYLNKITTNLIKDYWRIKGKKDKVIIDNEDGDLVMEDTIVTDITNRKKINYLINHLIPKLPCELRMIFLLRNESEFWEKKQPLQWEDLAVLLNMSIDEVKETYIRVSNKRNSDSTDSIETQELDCIERSVYLIWEQSQPHKKPAKLTFKYLADLLDIHESTYKTKYRKCIETLSEGLEEWEMMSTK